MSRFFSRKYRDLTPYTPGEQPRNRQYIKLNTNESPFPPSPQAVRMAEEAARNLHLYSDPACTALVNEAAECFGISPEEIIFTNGSDDILNFAFMAFCDGSHPAQFPDITYGFYSVFAALNHVPYVTVPLKDDFTVDPADYIGCCRTVFLANPNAPTGLCLPLSDIEAIVAGNPDHVVVIDEAYVDFGGQSAMGLIHKYPNLLVTRTFSKSRSLAGGRLGFAVGCKELIRDLNTIRYSTNPYNINSMTMAAGVGSLRDRAYFENACRAVMQTRAWTETALESRGFTFPKSSANFIFARHKTLGGKFLYESLRARGVLVRHFETDRLKDYNRITIGSQAQMEALMDALDAIIKENT